MSIRTIFIVMFFILASCNSRPRLEEIIDNTADIRQRIGLLSIERLQLDSSYATKFKYINGFRDIDCLPRVDSNELPELYYVVYNYSRNGMTKSLYFENKKSKLNLVEEEDRYQLKGNEDANCNLILNYNYLSNKVTYRIDSNATHLLEMRIRDTIEYRENHVPKGWEVCGTVMMRMAESMRPKESTLIEKAEYDRLKPER